MVNSLFRNSCYTNQQVDAPDPSNFNLLWYTPMGNNIIVCIDYPNCTNFEGAKLLVYLNTTFSSIEELTTIDPHFSEEGLSPIAIFKPTSQGFKLARIFLQKLIDIDYREI